MENLSPELRVLYEKRLWHELTEKLMELDGQTLSTIWSQITQFSERLNQIKLVLMAVKASETQDSAEARKFLESVEATEHQAGLLLRVNIAKKALSQGSVSEAQTILDDNQAEIERMTDLDPVLYSHLYGALAQLNKSVGNPELFYKYSLQFLAYTLPEDVPNREELAFQLGIAVLSAETIYNLGELLEQPILKSLEGSANAWLHELLHLFNEGKVSEIQQRFPNLPKELQTEQLMRKARILAMMEHIFSKSSWVLSFSELAQVMHVGEEEVEWLLMKAMALGLLEGKIDEVSKQVTIKWLQPKVLDIQRLSVLQSRISDWKVRVKEVLNYLEDQSKEILS